MLNLLPENQNQNKVFTLNFQKDKSYINQRDNSITNFIFIISIFLISLASFSSYLNLRNSISNIPDEDLQNAFALVSSKEEEIYLLNQDVLFMREYKKIKDGINIRNAEFLKSISQLEQSIPGITLQNISFQNNQNVFDFKLTFFVNNNISEELLRKIESDNKRISNLKVENIEKIEGATEYKYVISGKIDGR